MSLYKRGGVWWFKFRFGGQEIRESAKTSSKTVARDAQNARRRELENGYNGISKQKRAQLFGNAAESWRRERPPTLAPKTLELYALCISHLKKGFANRLLLDITAGDIAAYQTRRMKEKASGRTINMEVGVLRAIMLKNKCWGKVSDEVEFLPERRDVGCALTPEQESALLAAAADRRYKDSPFYVIVVLALNTAMRSKEIKTLRWTQIDLGKRTVTVGQSKTAAGTGRQIPLNQSAAAALEYWHSLRPARDPQHYVFPACENNKIDPDRPMKSFRTAWRNAASTAGLTGLRFHDLRHTAITKLAETLASDQTIMSIAGHVSRKMLEHYSHVRMDAKRKALEGIEQTGHIQGNWLQNRAQSAEPQNFERPN